MIHNYRISTVFVERSHLLSGEGVGDLPRAFYESVYDNAGTQGMIFHPAWEVPGDRPFWRMWCGGTKLPDGYGAWHAAVPLRIRPGFRAIDTAHRVDVKLECFAHTHTRAVIVSCISRNAHLNDDDWSATVRALRRLPAFAINDAAGTHVRDGLTLTELGRFIVAGLGGPAPVISHERMPPFSLITPCSDDGDARDWDEKRERALAATVISAGGPIADPFTGGRRNPVDIYHARTAAVLIGPRWMTASGHPGRLSHFHRNLSLGVMQVQALLQLVAEFDATPPEDRAFRQSPYEFATGCLSMLRRVIDGRGTYRSKLLEALASRHGSAAKRVSKMLDPREVAPERERL
jgi:hypothetical protein